MSIIKKRESEKILVLEIFLLLFRGVSGSFDFWGNFVIWDIFENKISPFKFQFFHVSIAHYSI
jgi:hypothetical protein